MPPSESAALFRKTVIVTSAGILTVAAALALYLSRWIFLGAVIGLGIGSLATPLLDTLKRRLRIPQGLGASIYVFLLFTVMSGITYILVNIVASQLGPLIDEFPKLMTDARRGLIELFGNAAWIRNALQSIEPGPAVQGAAQALYQGLQFGTVAVTGIVFALFIALYFAGDPDSYARAFLSLFPAYKRPGIKRILTASGVTLRKWFYAQLIAMSVVGFMTGIGLWIIDAPYPAAFGLMTAVLDIIPYIGPMMAFLAISIITLAENPGNLIWVAVIFVVMQNFEGDVVIPLAMKAGVKLPPIHLMVLMLIMASWFGILGVLVAPPVLAISRNIYLSTYVKRMDQKISDESVPQKKSA
ncbi:MAG: hypothetical protein A2X94_14770 [Bdellovibrionales bacterium GWB1_55_8]|nr:MAG: hypothetical protein A2X94_14770 [Bdellovibrionales bacterium GWB1_55_8]